jgi:hypothetical protein
VAQSTMTIDIFQIPHPTLIEKGNPYKECYMYIDGYVKSSTRECQQLGALGMRQQFNTQNRHGLNPE